MGKYLLSGLVCLLLLAGSAFAERVELSRDNADIEVTVKESSADRIVVQLEVGAFEKQAIDINGQTYFEINSGGESVMLEAGSPALPRVSRSVIIPDNARMGMNLVDAEYVDFVETPVIPSKGNLLRTVNPADVPYEFGSVYDEHAFFPSIEADFRAPYIMRDYRGTVIDFHPFQYNPGTQTLRVYTSITVELIPLGPGEINVLDRSKRPGTVVPEFELLYERRFINYSQNREKYTPVGEIGDLLIITYDDFADEMLPFVNWKLQKGIKTTMVNISDVGNNATSIDNYIQAFYDSTNLAFILLVGDAAQITTGTHDGGGADPKFTTTSGTDTYPDCFIGRFSAENGAQVTTQVDRNIDYELNTYAGSWLHKGMGVASNEGPGHDGGEYDHVHMGYIRDDLLAYNYTHVDEFYQPSATSAQVTSAMHDGRGFINYVGHGSTTAWSTTGFSNSHVNALTNDNMLPFIISVACVNGQFRFYTCFGEAWTRATNGGTPTGAVGAYMSTINQSWNPPMDGQDEVTDLLCAEAKTTYGGLCFNGSCKMMDDNPGASGYDMFYTWTIFGDPSLQVRSDIPSPITVNHPGAVFFNAPSYEVEVAGEEGALCALYADGVLYGSGYTDGSGMVTIPIDGMLPIGVGPVTLTVTGYNLDTYTSDVVVSTDLTIIHEPLGNTKDIVNDYEVTATVYSDAPLYYDSVLIHYTTGGAWEVAPMAALKLGEDFAGYIPVQVPGTTVEYYLEAKNDAGYTDTTDHFNFFVIDYGLILGPDGLSSTAPVYDTVWYDMFVTNDGVLDDSYSLAISGYAWSTALFDEYGVGEISATNVIAMDESFNFKLRVIVPESWEDEYDVATVTATSVGNGSFSANVDVTTVSAGQPWPIPFTDEFATTTFDFTKWDRWPGVTIDMAGYNPPSPPYAVNFDGNPNGGDTLVTEAINLRGESNVLLKYYYQRTGAGDSPESGDDLVVQIVDSLGAWQTVMTHDGSGADMTEFEEVELVLPPAAYHAGFRVKFYSSGSTGSYDDWFIDDFYVGHPVNYRVEMSPELQSQSGPAGNTVSYLVTLVNRGHMEDSYSFVASGNGWPVEFYDETGSTTWLTSPMVTGGDTLNFMVVVAIPSDAPPHDMDMATITATSNSDGGVSDQVSVETKSGGPAIAFPIYEPFVETSLSIDRWFENMGAEVSTDGMNAPSAPYSLCLDGGDDTVITRLIDISGQSGAVLSYYYQCGGAVDPPEPGENLYIEYKNNVGEWITINTHIATGGAMTSFEYVNLPLPMDAVHTGFQLRLISDGGGVNTDNWFMDDIRVDHAPAITIDAMDLDHSMAPGASTEVPMYIHNDGPGGLSYQLSVSSLLNKGALGGLVAVEDRMPAKRDYPADFFNGYVDEKGVDQPNRGYPVTRGLGGPDEYGYYWIDSDEAGGPTFDWVDVSAVGTDIIDQLDDDNYTGPIDIGFDFPFYGAVHSQLYVSSNGLIGFDSTDLKNRLKTTIPTSGTPNNFIAWMWDDLNPDDADNLGANVYVHSDGERMVIQFVDYPEYSAAPGDLITAEVILYADGGIKIQYLSIAAGFDVASGTVGIENGTGTDGLEVAYATSYLKENLAVYFVKPYDWLTLDKSFGTIDPGGVDTVMCTVAAGDEMDEGTYNATIVVTSNDPDPTDNPILLPAELTVTTGPIYVCGDADGNGTGPDIADMVYLVDYMFNEGAPPPEMLAVDLDGNGGSIPDIADLVYLVEFMFNGGAAPVCGGN